MLAFCLEKAHLTLTSDTADCLYPDIFVSRRFSLLRLYSRLLLAFLYRQLAFGAKRRLQLT